MSRPITSTKVILEGNNYQYGRFRVVAQFNDNQVENIVIETPGKDATDKERWDFEMKFKWSGGEIENLSSRQSKILFAIFQLVAESKLPEES